MVLRDKNLGLFSSQELIITFLFLYSSLFSCSCKERRPKTENLSSRKSIVSSREIKKEIKRGSKLYRQHGCVACHGETGKGDGFAGTKLSPPPRDYSELSAYKQGSSREDIAKTLSIGVPDTAMAAYPYISKEDRLAIASFIINIR